MPVRSEWGAFGALPGNPGFERGKQSRTIISIDAVVAEPPAAR